MDNVRTGGVEDAVKLSDKRITLTQNPRKRKVKEDNWDKVRKKKTKVSI